MPAKVKYALLKAAWAELRAKGGQRARLTPAEMDAACAKAIEALLNQLRELLKAARGSKDAAQRAEVKMQLDKVEKLVALHKPEKGASWSALVWAICNNNNNRG